jgi:ubiquinone/menaquinone biosynthesis C-methylase UbiE
MRFMVVTATYEILMSQIQRHTEYDHIAGTYDRRYERNSYEGVEQALQRFVGSEPGSRILEVGCGTGHWLEFLQPLGMHLMGLDFSAGMLAKAHIRLPGVALVQGTAERLPWPAESFDRIFCINALHHFADKATFLAETRRILRPTGRILIIGLDPHRGVDQWFVYDYFPESVEIDSQRYPAASSLRTWMREAGFRDCITQEVEHWTYRLPAREILQQGRLDKTATSQLSVLTDAEYQRGMDRIRADIERLEAKGQTLFLTADLRLFGTSGCAANCTV